MSKFTNALRSLVDVTDWKLNDPIDSWEQIPEYYSVLAFKEVICLVSRMQVVEIKVWDLT